MLGRSHRDRMVEVCAAAGRMLTSVMLAFRNKLLAGGMPTEDVNELLIRLMK